MDRITAWLDPWNDRVRPRLPQHPGLLRARARRRPGRRPRARAGWRAACSCPTPSNDFIFAIIGEEFGLLGAGLVIVLFLAIGYLGIRTVAGRAGHVRGAARGRDHRLDLPPGVRQHRRSWWGSSPSRASRCRSSRPAARRSSSASRPSASCSRSPARRSRKEPGTMRLLIAGGGTGGHIYPALAVARSLRARAGAPELGWLGGHRGLEADIVPPAGIPLRRLLAALAALGRSRRPPRPRSRPPGAVDPAGAGPAARPPPGGHLHHRRLRRHPDAARGSACCASRACCGTAT